LIKWIASDIPRGFVTGLANEYKEKNIPCIEISCGLAGGSLQFIERFGKKSIIFSEELGCILVLLLSTLKQVIIQPFEIRNTVRKMLEIEIRSLPVVMVTAIFTRMVLGLQTLYRIQEV
jgi:ABC-type transporter Mla maintaining outer membrane lipid asymmetry permease subunit MlaE